MAEESGESTEEDDVSGVGRGESEIEWLGLQHRKAAYIRLTICCVEKRAVFLAHPVHNAKFDRIVIVIKVCACVYVRRRRTKTGYARRCWRERSATSGRGNAASTATEWRNSAPTCCLRSSTPTSANLPSLVPVCPPGRLHCRSLAVKQKQISPTSSSLRIPDRCFWYASPCLWNQRSSSLSVNLIHSLCLCPACSRSYHIFSLCQFTTLTIHNPLSLSLPAQDLPLSQIFPIIHSFPASGLTPQTSRLDCFFWASRFLFLVSSLLIFVWFRAAD